MTNEEKTAIAILAGSAVVLSAQAIHYLHVRKTERAKRAAIRIEADKEIAAIKLAAVKTKARMDSGEFKPQSFSEIETAFDFERIAARFND